MRRLKILALLYVSVGIFAQESEDLVVTNAKIYKNANSLHATQDVKYWTREMEQSYPTSKVYELNMWEEDPLVTAIVAVVKGKTVHSVTDYTNNVWTVWLKKGNRRFIVFAHWELELMFGADTIWTLPTDLTCYIREVF
jgi:hypothetical protein